MKVEFKFDINQKVKTVFGDIGFVQMCCIDDEKHIKYWVQRNQDSQWMKEKQISSVCEENE
jgi:hypothetical protein